MVGDVQRGISERLGLPHDASPLPGGVRAECLGRKAKRSLLAHPEQALDVLAREELGLNPDDLGSPWGAAFASFVSFAAGALVPLIPFVAHMSGTPALTATAALTATSLFAVGMALSLFTGRDAWRGAVRMVLIGGGAGLVSYFVGRALGVALG